MDTQSRIDLIVSLLRKYRPTLDFDTVVKEDGVTELVLKYEDKDPMPIPLSQDANWLQIKQFIDFAEKYTKTNTEKKSEEFIEKEKAAHAKLVKIANELNEKNKTAESLDAMVAKGVEQANTVLKSGEVDAQPPVEEALKPEEEVLAVAQN
jgi:hypothetical protein